jgi:hypothetical protein
LRRGHCCRPRPAFTQAGDAHAHETALRFRGLPMAAAGGDEACRFAMRSGRGGTNARRNRVRFRRLPVVAAPSQ